MINKETQEKYLAIYAGLAMLGKHESGYSNEESARECFDQAETMVAELKRRQASGAKDDG